MMNRNLLMITALCGVSSVVFAGTAELVDSAVASVKQTVTAGNAGLEKQVAGLAETTNELASIVKAGAANAAKEAAAKAAAENAVKAAASKPGVLVRTVDGVKSAAVSVKNGTVSGAKSAGNKVVGVLDSVANGMTTAGNKVSNFYYKHETGIKRTGAAVVLVAATVVTVLGVRKAIAYFQNKQNDSVEDVTLEVTPEETSVEEVPVIE